MFVYVGISLRLSRNLECVQICIHMPGMFCECVCVCCVFLSLPLSISLLTCMQLVCMPLQAISTYCTYYVSAYGIFRPGFCVPESQPTRISADLKLPGPKVAYRLLLNGIRHVPGPPKEPKIMAQYPKIETISSLGSIVLGSFGGPGRGCCQTFESISKPGRPQATEPNFDPEPSLCLSTLYLQFLILKTH